MKYTTTRRVWCYYLLQLQAQPQVKISKERQKEVRQLTERHGVKTKHTRYRDGKYAMLLDIPISKNIESVISEIMQIRNNNQRVWDEWYMLHSVGLPYKQLQNVIERM